MQIFEITTAKRQAALQGILLCSIICTALMIWKGLSVYWDTESPIVVVLSESMEPAFQRGDLLFLSNPKTPIRVGDITVFKLAEREIPIVHRVLALHEDKKTGEQFLLTKGDNNGIDDRGLYNQGRSRHLPQVMWINQKDVKGRVTGFLPYIGMVTILMNDYPKLKYALLGVLGLLAVFNKDV